MISFDKKVNGLITIFRDIKDNYWSNRDEEIKAFVNGMYEEMNRYDVNSITMKVINEDLLVEQVLGIGTKIAKEHLFD